MSGRPAVPRLGFHLQPGQRVGLYGGSFNPAHEGHRHVAQTALRRLGLDRILWLVSPGNPLKGPAGAALSERMASAKAFAGGAKMVVSDVEARLACRYSIDTVRQLRRRFGGVKFVWIVGADNLASLHLWRDWQRLIRQVPLAIVARPGSSLAALNSPAARRFAGARLPAAAGRRLADAKPPAWIYLTAPWRAVSSTALRNSPDRNGGA